MPQEEPVWDSVGEGEALAHSEAEVEPLGESLDVALPLPELDSVGLRDWEGEPL